MINLNINIPSLSSFTPSAVYDNTAGRVITAAQGALDIFGTLYSVLMIGESVQRASDYLTGTTRNYTVAPIQEEIFPPGLRREIERNHTLPQMGLQNRCTRVCYRAE